MARQRWCARCKTPIDPERIEVLPETRLCLPCSQAVGGEFIVSLEQENLGKAGSLKKNYGSMALHKRRKPLT